MNRPGNATVGLTQRDHSIGVVERGVKNGSAFFFCEAARRVAAQKLVEGALRKWLSRWIDHVHAERPNSVMRFGRGRVEQEHGTHDFSPRQFRDGGARAFVG